MYAREGAKSMHLAQENSRLRTENEVTKSVQSAIRKAVTEEAYGAAVMNALRD
jgi:hypothetical protein